MPIGLVSSTSLQETQTAACACTGHYVRSWVTCTCTGYTAAQAEMLFYSLAKRFGEIILPKSKNLWYLTLRGILMLQVSCD